MSWMRKKKRSTGRVDLTHLCAHLTSGNVWVHRDGNVVNLSFYRVQLSAAGDPNQFIMTLPAGYRPDVEQVVESVKYSTTDTLRSFQIASTGAIGITAKSDTGTQMRMSVAFVTTDQWPA